MKEEEILLALSHLADVLQRLSSAIELSSQPAKPESIVIRGTRKLIKADNILVVGPVPVVAVRANPARWLLMVSCNGLGLTPQLVRTSSPNYIITIPGGITGAAPQTFQGFKELDWEKYGPIVGMDYSVQTPGAGVADTTTFSVVEVINQDD